MKVQGKPFRAVSKVAPAQTRFDFSYYRNLGGFAPERTRRRVPESDRLVGVDISGTHLASYIFLLIDRFMN